MQSDYQVIDLSRPIHTKMPVFPGISKTYLGVYLGHKDTLRPGNISAQTNILVMCDHAGIHIDAPLHFNPEGSAIDSMPVDIMVGNAVMQDYSFKKNAESITAAEVEENLEKINVKPRDLKYILLRTGTGEYYATDEYLTRCLEVRVDGVEWMLDAASLSSVSMHQRAITRKIRQPACSCGSGYAITSRTWPISTNCPVTRCLPLSPTHS